MTVAKLSRKYLPLEFSSLIVTRVWQRLTFQTRRGSPTSRISAVVTGEAAPAPSRGSVLPPSRQASVSAQSRTVSPSRRRHCPVPVQRGPGVNRPRGGPTDSRTLDALTSPITGRPGGTPRRRRGGRQRAVRALAAAASGWLVATTPRGAKTIDARASRGSRSSFVAGDPDPDPKPWPTNRIARQPTRRPVPPVPCFGAPPARRWLLDRVPRHRPGWPRTCGLLRDTSDRGKR